MASETRAVTEHSFLPQKVGPPAMPNKGDLSLLEEVCKQHRTPIIKLCFIFLLFSCFSISVTSVASIQGQYQTRAYAETQADNGGGLINFNSPEPLMLSNLNYSAAGIFNGIAIFAHGSLAGSASYGILKAYTHTDSGANRPYSMDIVTGYAYVELEVLDWLTPTSSALQASTPVAVEFTSTIDGTVTAGPVPVAGMCGLTAFFEFSSSADRLIQSGCESQGAFLKTLDQIVTLRIGQPFHLIEILDTEVGTGSGYSNTTSSATVAALDTATLDIKVLPPGASFTTKSGATYAHLSRASPRCYPLA